MAKKIVTTKLGRIVSKFGSTDQAFTQQLNKADLEQSLLIDIMFLQGEANDLLWKSFENRGGSLNNPYCWSPLFERMSLLDEMKILMEARFPGLDDEFTESTTW